MKRVLAILLCAVLACALLAACGEDKGKEVVTSDGTKIVENKDGTISLKVDYEKIGEASKKQDAKVPENGKHVQTITAEEKTLLVPIGKTVTIKPVITPTDASDKSVTYASKNEAIAKVDKDGKVLGVEAGSTKIEVITNDRNFKCSVTVNVYRVKSADEKINELLGMINKARTDAELGELEFEDKLNYAATERAFEEAAEGDSKMDDDRPLPLEGEKKTHNTVLNDFDIFVRASNRIYIWKSKASVKDIYEEIMKNEDYKNLLLSEDGKYTHIGAGCFEYKDVAYWCVLLYQS